MCWALARGYGTRFAGILLFQLNVINVICAQRLWFCARERAANVPQMANKRCDHNFHPMQYIQCVHCSEPMANAQFSWYFYDLIYIHGKHFCLLFSDYIYVCGFCFLNSKWDNVWQNNFQWAKYTTNCTRIFEHTALLLCFGSIFISFFFSLSL